MGLDDQITAARRAYDIQVQATRSAISDELAAAKRLSTLYDRLGGPAWRLKPDMGIWERVDGLWLSTKDLRILAHRYRMGAGEILKVLDGRYPLGKGQKRRPWGLWWVIRWHYFWQGQPRTLGYLLFVAKQLVAMGLICWVAVSDYPWCAFGLAIFFLSRNYTGETDIFEFPEERESREGQEDESRIERLVNVVAERFPDASRDVIEQAVREGVNQQR